MALAHDIVILEGARTPIGKFLGALRGVSATELATTSSLAAIERANVAATDIDSVVFGNVLQSSKDAAYIARHVGLNAGVPIPAPALAVNRACGSGMEAIVQASTSLMVGDATCVLAGGAENMSMTPYAMRGVREGWKMIRTDVDDMLFSALHDAKAGCSIGETVEHLAAELGITRERADQAAAEGQIRAAKAQANGVYAEEIAPVEIKSRRGSKTVETDGNLRPETTVEALAALPGLYGGVITAGNSCGLNDAAASVVVTHGAWASDRGLAPLGRVVSWASVGVEPIMMGLGPIAASKAAVQQAGLTLEDMDVIELNDSFTVQSLAVIDALELDAAKVNPNGGAIALGHPMGATGTRLVLSALYHLRRTGGQYGLCTVCIGGGQGIAMVVART